MKTKGKIQYNGEEYPIAVNFNVIELIQEEYHSFKEWAELLVGDEPPAKAIKFGLWAMINEGIDIEREQGVQRESLTMKQVGRIITEMGFSNAQAAMQNAIIESTEGGDEKN